MLSVEKVSDPSCSSNISAVKTDERAPQGLDCQEADQLVLDHNTAPNFSIRNYVFALRDKDIETNWPFAKPFLRLCLKSGIKDVLPSFEPPNLVRVHCHKKLEEPYQLASSPDTAETSEQVNLLEPDHVSLSNGKEAVIGQKSCSQCEEQYLDSTNKAVSPSENWKSEVYQVLNFDELVHTNDPIVSTLTTNEQNSAPVSGVSCTSAIDRSASEQPSESEVAELSNKLEKLQEPSEKKCKLIVKLTATSEPSWMDDLASNTSAVSDPIASKVCPVCKAFSSSSNTTLNAHIDQCLSMESNTKTTSNLTKLKVKPRKKRLMVDIYTDARPCTLEDLDRRNGTNWTVEMALLVTPPSEAVTNTKKPKLALPVPRDEATNDAVYVDSNGIKLRILSKFNDIMPLPSDDFRVKNNMEEKSIAKKKKHFGSKFNKKMKMMAQTKKPHSLKVLKYQMQHVPERDLGTENNWTTDEFVSHGRDARVPFKDGERSTCNYQQGSQYCNTVGKLSNGDTYDSMGSVSPARRNLPTENWHLHKVNSSSPIRHEKKILKLTTFPSGSSKTKSVKFLCRAANTMCGENRSPEPRTSDSEQYSESSLSGNGFLPESSRSSKAFMSLANKGLGLHTKINEKLKYSSQMTSTFPNMLATKHQRYSTLKKNQFTENPLFSLAARKGEAGDIPSCSKVLRKQRSVLRTNKRAHFIQPPVNEMHAPIRNPVLAIARNDDTLSDLKSSTSMSVAGLETVHQVSLIKRATKESEKRDYSSMMEGREDDILNSSQSEAEFCANITVAEISDKRVDFVDSWNCETSSSDKMPLAGESTNIESLKVASISRLDADTCMEKDTEDFLPCEAHDLERFKPESDKKEKTEGEVFGSGIDLQGAEVVGEIKTCDAENPFALQPIEFQADATSVQESCGCLTSREDSDLDKPTKNSSITSAGTTMDQEQNLDSDVELVESTVSLPSPKDSEAKDAETISVAGDSNVKGRLNASAYSSSENGYGVEKESKIDQILDATSSVKETEKITDKKSFCCSCRESLSRGSQFLKQNTNARIGKVMPVSNLVIRPRNTSSFTKYQNRSVNVAATSSFPSDPSTFSQNTFNSTLMYPYCSDNICSPSTSAQSASNATLRLMGQNLVLNHDGHSQPQTNGSVYQSAVSTSTAGVLSTNDVQLNNFHYPRPNQLMSRSPAFSTQMLLHLPNPTFVGFTGPPFTDSCMTIPDQQTQPKKHEAPISYRAPYPQEVIMIDDSPERRSDLNGVTAKVTGTLPLFTSGVGPLPKVQSSYYRPQSPLLEVSGPSRNIHTNVYTNVYPSLNSVSFMSRGNNTEYQCPILPSHIVFRSATGPRTSSLFYSETMH